MTYPKIKELREENGYIQKIVADKLNIPITTYRSYENGKREPSTEILIAMSELYNVSVDYILDHKPKTTVLSKEELDHMKKYHDLDEHGRKIVDLVTDVELERCAEQNKIRSFRAASSIDNHEPEIDISEYTQNIAAGTGEEGFTDKKINEVNEFAEQIYKLENPD